MYMRVRKGSVGITEATKSILLVDDEKDMGWVIGRIFTDAGYRMIAAQTGAEGLAKFREGVQSIRLVLLDLRLPDMSGLELLERMKSLSPHVKVLMITSFGRPEIRDLARKKGATDVLDKPFRVEKILKAARLAFEERGGAPASSRESPLQATRT